MSTQVKIKSYQIYKNRARKKSPKTATIASLLELHPRVDPPVSSGDVLVAAPVALSREPRVGSKLVGTRDCVLALALELELELELTLALALATPTTLVVLVLAAVITAVTVLS